MKGQTETQITPLYRVYRETPSGQKQYLTKWLMNFQDALIVKNQQRQTERLVGSKNTILIKTTFINLIVQ